MRMHLSFHLTVYFLPFGADVVLSLVSKGIERLKNRHR